MPNYSLTIYAYYFFIFFTSFIFFHPKRFQVSFFASFCPRKASTKDKLLNAFTALYHPLVVMIGGGSDGKGKMETSSTDDNRRQRINFFADRMRVLSATDVAFTFDATTTKGPLHHNRLRGKSDVVADDRSHDVRSAEKLFVDACPSLVREQLYLGRCRFHVVLSTRMSQDKSRSSPIRSEWPIITCSSLCVSPVVVITLMMATLATVLQPLPYHPCLDHGESSFVNDHR